MKPQGSVESRALPRKPSVEVRLEFREMGLELTGGAWLIDCRVRHGQFSNSQLASFPAATRSGTDHPLLAQKPDDSQGDGGVRANNAQGDAVEIRSEPSQASALVAKCSDSSLPTVRASASAWSGLNPCFAGQFLRCGQCVDRGHAPTLLHLRDVLQFRVRNRHCARVLGRSLSGLSRWRTSHETRRVSKIQTGGSTARCTD